MRRAKGERLKAKGTRRRGIMIKGGPKFKELRVWQKGKELAVYIYQISIKIFKHKNKLNCGDKYGNKSKSEI